MAVENAANPSAPITAAFPPAMEQKQKLSVKANRP